MKILVCMDVFLITRNYQKTKHPGDEERKFFKNAINARNGKGSSVNFFEKKNNSK